MFFYISIPKICTINCQLHYQILNHSAKKYFLFFYSNFFFCFSCSCSKLFPYLTPGLPTGNVRAKMARARWSIGQSDSSRQFSAIPDNSRDGLVRMDIVNFDGWYQNNNGTRVAQNSDEQNKRPGWRYFALHFHPSCDKMSGLNGLQIIKMNYVSIISIFIYNLHHGRWAHLKSRGTETAC